MRKSRPTVWMLLALAALCRAAPEARFPRPDFSQGYQYPVQHHPLARAGAWEGVDIALLAGALVLTAWFVWRRRSRCGVFWTMAASLAYFGFVRKGCVCPVGSLQNVTQAAADSGYVLPGVVLVFFLLPVVFALFAGRVFCGGVCPLGALQDMLVLRPLRLPRRLDRVLSLIPVVVLGLTVLFAGTGAGYIVCRYDPFVGFFRQQGPLALLVGGGVLLLVCLVVARPYCRYFCPYGVVLGAAAKLSPKPLAVCPGECINCGLCAAACPFEAIEPPQPAENAAERERNVSRLRVALLLLPVWMILGGWALASAHVPLSRLHHRVALAETVLFEDANGITALTERSGYFRATGEPVAELLADARRIRRRFRLGGWLTGSLTGLALGMRLVHWARRYMGRIYEVDRGRCLSCGRCLAACPVAAIGQAGTADRNEG